MKIPTRPAPTPTAEQRRMRSQNSSYDRQPITTSSAPKKKPPPRPPPPKFTNGYSSRTAVPSFTPAYSNGYSNGISKQPKPDFSTSLIDLTTPDPAPSTSAAIRTNGSNNFTVGKSSFFTNGISHSNSLSNINGETSVSQISQKFGPTIIRPRPKRNVYARIEEKPERPAAHKVNIIDRSEVDSNNYSPPMPTVPPPSPPKVAEASVEPPYGIALHDYPASHPDDLPLQVDDIVYILRKVNDEWLYGKVGDREGMFPASFIDIHIPLPDSNEVTVLYQFNGEMPEDLPLVPGQTIKVLSRVSPEWLYGESNGRRGQFPTNFVDHVPPGI